jgi:hypothetical protein
VRFLGLFVKLALQTNQKLGLKSLQWVLLASSNFSFQNNQKYTFDNFDNSPF